MQTFASRRSTYNAFRSSGGGSSTVGQGSGHAPATRCNHPSGHPRRRSRSTMSASNFETLMPRAFARARNSAATSSDTYRCNWGTARPPNRTYSTWSSRNHAANSTSVDLTNVTDDLVHRYRQPGRPLPTQAICHLARRDDSITDRRTPAEPATALRPAWPRWVSHRGNDLGVRR